MFPSMQSLYTYEITKTTKDIGESMIIYARNYDSMIINV